MAVENEEVQVTIQSRVPSREYRDSYDRIFRKAKGERKERSKKRTRTKNASHGTRGGPEGEGP